MEWRRVTCVDVHEDVKPSKDVPAERDRKTSSEPELWNKALKIFVGTSKSIKASPESFLKHTIVFEDSPASSRYRHVSRTLFKRGRQKRVIDAEFIGDDSYTSIINGDIAEAKEADYVGRGNDTINNTTSSGGTISPSTESAPSTESPPVLSPSDGTSGTGQQTKNDEANALALRSVVRAHRDDVFEHQAKCNEKIQDNQQDCEDRIAYWQTKSETDNEGLTADSTKIQDRVAQAEQGWKEEREITRVELVKTRNERDELQQQIEVLHAKLEGWEKLQPEVRTLETERNKHINRTLHLGKELEQEQKSSAQLKKSTDIERKNLQMSIRVRGEKHQAEVQELKKHHANEISALQRKAESDRAMSQRKERKLKHALKDMEIHFVKVEKTSGTAIQTAKIARENEVQNLKERPEDDRTGTKNILGKTILKNDLQEVALDELKTQAEDSLPESSEDVSDDPCLPVEPNTNFNAGPPRSRSTSRSSNYRTISSGKASI